VVGHEAPRELRVFFGLQRGAEHQEGMDHDAGVKEGVEESGDRAELLARTADLLRHQLDVPYFTVLLWDEEAQHLEAVYSSSARGALSSSQSSTVK